jgi:uncharacterized phage protein (TIGR01671 family)
MNRTIKFRGKSLNTGEWVYGSLVTEKYENDITYAIVTDTSFESVDTCGGDVDLCATAFIVDPKTVGQYIGVKDKNNKEIYNGDVTEHVPRFEAMYFVKYLTSGFYLCPNNKDYGEYFASLFAGHDGKNHCRSIEVIGNIHDNPNLLTQ